MARRPTQAQQWEALLAEYDAKIRDAFLEAIAEVTNSVTLKAIADRLERGDLQGALDAMQLESAAFRALDEAVRQAMTAGAVGAAANLPVVRGSNGARLIFRFDVRALSAEAWLQNHSSSLITRIIAEQRETIRTALTAGMAAGQNPTRTALDIVGRLDRVTGRRTGGIIGLTRQQERTMAWVREAFRTGDTEGLHRYLGLALRDKRFDRTIMAAIRDGNLSAVDAEKIAGRLADRYLKHRGDVIGRTESLASLNAGRTETFRQAVEKAGIDQQHVTRAWSATMDRKTRDTHQAMNGQKVKGLDTPFTSPTGARLMFPGDTSLGAPADEVVQCRCRVDLRVDWMEGRA